MLEPVALPAKKKGSAASIVLIPKSRPRDMFSVNVIAMFHQTGAAGAGAKCIQTENVIQQGCPYPQSVYVFFAAASVKL